MDHAPNAAFSACMVDVWKGSWRKQWSQHENFGFCKMYGNLQLFKGLGGSFYTPE
jgi:hypothetical protein